MRWILGTGKSSANMLTFARSDKSAQVSLNANTKNFICTKVSALVSLIVDTIHFKRAWTKTIVFTRCEKFAQVSRIANGFDFMYRNVSAQVSLLEATTNFWCGEALAQVIE